MRLLLAVPLVLCLAASAASAHPGPRVWIGSDGVRVTTYTSNNDLSPTSYSASRLFVAGIDEDTLQPTGRLDEVVPGSGVYSDEFPGYQVRLDGAGGIAQSANIGFRIAGPLLAFNAPAHRFDTTAALFGTPGPTPQIGVSIGSNLRITGAGPVDGFTILTYNSGDAHGHPFMTLYGNGTGPSDGPQAIYALPLRLTAGGLADSETYYILLGRGFGLTDPTYQEALTVARQTLVPEPTSAVLLVAGGLALLGRRRPRRVG